MECRTVGMAQCNSRWPLRRSAYLTLRFCLVRGESPIDRLPLRWMDGWMDVYVMYVCSWCILCTVKYSLPCALCIESWVVYCLLPICVLSMPSVYSTVQYLLFTKTKSISSSSSLSSFLLSFFPSFLLSPCRRDITNLSVVMPGGPCAWYLCRFLCLTEHSWLSSSLLLALSLVDVVIDFVVMY